MLEISIPSSHPENKSKDLKKSYRSHEEVMKIPVNCTRLPWTATTLKQIEP